MRVKTELVKAPIMLVRQLQLHLSCTVVLLLTALAACWPTLVLAATPNQSTLGELQPAPRSDDAAQHAVLGVGQHSDASAGIHIRFNNFPVIGLASDANAGAPSAAHDSQVAVPRATRDLTAAMPRAAHNSDASVDRTVFGSNGGASRRIHDPQVAVPRATHDSTAAGPRAEYTLDNALDRTASNCNAGGSRTVLDSQVAVPRTTHDSTAAMPKAAYSLATEVNRTVFELDERGMEVEQTAVTARRQLQEHVLEVQGEENAIVQEQWQQVWMKYVNRHQEVLYEDDLAPGVGFIKGEVANSGLGNRMAAAMSVLVIALATNRIALFESLDFNQHFQPAVDMRFSTYAGKLQRWGIDPVGHQIPKVDWKLWLQTNWTEHFASHRMITYPQIGDYMGTYFTINSFHRPYFESLPPGDIFASLAPFLFELNPELQFEVNKFQKSNFRRFMIGIQLRHLSLSFDTNKLPPVHYYAKLAQKMITSHRFAAEATRYFIAADTLQAYKTMADVLRPDKVVFTKNGISDRLHPVMSSVANPGTPESAVIDMKLLSMGDALIVTQGSTFGYIAAAWGGKTAHVIRHGEGERSSEEMYFEPVKGNTRHKRNRQERGHQSRYYIQRTTEPGSWLLKDFVRSAPESLVRYMQETAHNWQDLLARHP